MLLTLEDFLRNQPGTREVAVTCAEETIRGAVTDILTALAEDVYRAGYIVNGYNLDRVPAGEKLLHVYVTDNNTI